MSGIPAAAGTAVSADTPGTTSQSIPAAVERVDLLTAATEEKRVAALQADDGLEAAAEGDEQLVDLGLAQPGAGDLQSPGGRLGEQLRRRELVVDDGVGPLQQPRSPAW